MSNKSAFIYVNYENSQETLNSVSKIKNNLDDEDSIFIVDNNSSELNKNILIEGVRGVKKIQVILNEDNLGFSSGVNIGLKLSRSLGYCFHFVCNPDTRFSINDVKKLITSSNSYKATISSPLVKNEHEVIDKNIFRKIRTYTSFLFSTGFIGLFLSFLPRPTSEHIICKITYADVISGCFFLINDRFGDITLDEDLFLYLEEFALAQELKKRNLKTIIDPSVEIIHLTGRKSGAQSIAQKLHHEYESLSIYLSKYYPSLILNELVLLNFKLKIIVLRLLGR